MKKIFLSVILFLFVALNVHSQKFVYDDNAEKRTVSSFHAIQASAGIQVFITKSDKEELAVTASEKELISKVETTVKDGVLRINRESDWKFWKNFKSSHIKVYVSYKNLDALDANSGATITGNDIQLNKLIVKQSSGSIIELSGTADALLVTGNSGSVFNGSDLKTENCSADVNSGSIIKTNVSKELIAKATSGGVIRYKGEGSIRDIHVNSGGTVRKQN